jgi:hypothetical protein
MQNNMYTYISNNNNINTPLIEPLSNNKKKIINYIFKRLIMFMIHVSLIALFEILFFFYIVSVYEDKALINLISEYTRSVPNICNNMSYQQKEYITMFFNKYINKTNIIINANISYILRTIYNNKLYISSWMYFVGIFIINLFFLGINYFMKLNINLFKILLDNIFMIIILGIYEYIFFYTIILKYENISYNELTLTMVNSFDLCIIPNITNKKN